MTSLDNLGKNKVNSTIQICVIGTEATYICQVLQYMFLKETIVSCSCWSAKDQSSNSKLQKFELHY